MKNITTILLLLTFFSCAAEPTRTEDGHADIGSTKKHIGDSDLLTASGTQGTYYGDKSPTTEAKPNNLESTQPINTVEHPQTLTTGSRVEDRNKAYGQESNSDSLNEGKRAKEKAGVGLRPGYVNEDDTSNDNILGRVSPESQMKHEAKGKKTIIIGIHDEFDALLNKYVDAAGNVNYKGFISEKSKLEAYLDKLSSTDPRTIDSRQAQMAFYINLYNAATIKLILDNYPLKSILDLDNEKTWDIDRVRLHGKLVSLNFIEHQILRPKYNDARIHFAVNCAAKSCPPLANQAYTAQNLEKLLETNTRAFINNKNYNEINEGTLRLSKIFEWYREDFGESLQEYLMKFSDIVIKESASIQFNEYDWALNGY